MNNELDSKQKVLVAFYTEYQKDVPNIKSINYQLLEMDRIVFNIAVMKLQNEGLIRGADISKGSGMSTVRALTADVLPTSKGLEYVESKLEIVPDLSNSEKVKKALEKTGAWGLTQFKDVLAKIAAETIKTTLAP